MTSKSYYLSLIDISSLKDIDHHNKSTGFNFCTSGLISSSVSRLVTVRLTVFLFIFPALLPHLYTYISIESFFLTSHDIRFFSYIFIFFFDSTHSLGNPATSFFRIIRASCHLEQILLPCGRDSTVCARLIFFYFLMIKFKKKFFQFL